MTKAGAAGSVLRSHTGWARSSGQFARTLGRSWQFQSKPASKSPFLWPNWKTLLTAAGETGQESLFRQESKIQARPMTRGFLRMKETNRPGCERAGGHRSHSRRLTVRRDWRGFNALIHVNTLRSWEGHKGSLDRPMTGSFSPVTRPGAESAHRFRTSWSWVCMVSPQRCPPGFVSLPGFFVGYNMPTPHPLLCQDSLWATTCPHHTPSNTGILQDRPMRAWGIGPSDFCQARGALGHITSSDHLRQRPESQALVREGHRTIAMQLRPFWGDIYEKQQSPRAMRGDVRMWWKWRFLERRVGRCETLAWESSGDYGLDMKSGGAKTENSI